MDVVLMLERVDLFRGLKAEDIRELESKADVVVYAKGTTIIWEGHQPDWLYVIELGKVQVFSSDAGGNEVIFGRLGPGECFGELALLDDCERSASVRAVVDSKVWKLSKHAFQECCQRHPSIYPAVVAGLVERIRTLNRGIKEFALLTVRERLLKTLLRLSKRRGDDRVIDYRPTHQELASMVGASREMVTKMLKDFVAEGHVLIRANEIVIPRDSPVIATPHASAG
jgi:CRP/FNR family cyclic AMP-dependent transcriptional regulator